MNRTTALNHKEKIRAYYAADGLMTLLAQEILNGNQNKYIDTTRFGRVYCQVWTGVSGNSVSALKARISMQPTPNYKDTSYYLGSNLNLDNYGVKWTGWLMPPISGDYKFFVRSDDASSFYLSSDTSLANLSTAPICSLAVWSYAWPTSGSGVSKAISLMAGKRYYFEYYHKEGSGNDFGQVGWDGPEWLSERPITAKYITEYASDPTYSGTTLVGGIPVHYQVTMAGLDAYNLFTEAALNKPGSSSDTAFRVPLSQYLSVKGTPAPPPDTVWMRTLYYDYHTDISNPDFEKISGDWVEGMVKPTEFTYDATNAGYFGKATLPKPVRGTTIYASCGLDKWFRPWRPGDFTIPGYYGGTNYRSCGDVKTVTYDTAFKNKVIKDSIPFIRDRTQGPNTYVFNRAVEPDTQFFPIDDRGFDCAGCTTEKWWANDGRLHNPSFCTEIHTSFTHFSGATFEFRGDDDVWVFINDSLVLDMGGIHPAWYKYLYMDDLKSLKFGNTYNLDFFGCERGHQGSGFKVATNLFIPRPKGAPIASYRRDYGNLD